MKSFEYTAAANVPEAIAQLKDANVVVLAGGVDLLDRMKEGLVSPSRLVSIRSLADLAFVREDAAGLHLGPLVTLAQLADAPDPATFPAIATTGWTHTFGPSVSNHFVYTYAQPLVGEFSSFGSNYTINRYPPNVFTVITTTSRTNYGHDSAEIGSARPRYVPEPRTLCLMGIGILGIGMVARRRLTARN